MPKNSKRIPPALKSGIYSGLDILPTESRAKFRKFKKQTFAELNLVGRLEEDIGEEIVRLEWRRQNLFTYDLAARAPELGGSVVVPPFDSIPTRQSVLADPFGAAFSVSTAAHA